jgi:hypothetical protein
MLSLLTAPENLPFTVAISVMVAIALAEGVALLLGIGLSETIDTLLPEVDLDIGAAPDGASAFTRLLGWLHVGRVPVLMILIVFLTAFGIIGLALQSAASSIVGSYMPGWLASIPTFFLSLPVVRGGAGLLAIIMPGDETDAVSENTFIGRTATITLGRAQLGKPAEAKLSDEHGHTHYIMIEPDKEGITFEQGTSVLITEGTGGKFRGIVHDSPGLKED